MSFQKKYINRWINIVKGCFTFAGECEDVLFCDLYNWVWREMKVNRQRESHALSPL